MPRYIFSFRKGSGDPDKIGVDLAGVHEARVEACRCLGEELMEQPRDLWDDGEWYIDVTDESETVLFTVFGAAYEAAAPHRKDRRHEPAPYRFAAHGDVHRHGEAQEPEYGPHKPEG